MIYLDNSPPDMYKEYKWKSMFIKKAQESFSIEAKGLFIIFTKYILIDFSTFTAELILETHVLGVLYHLKGC